MEAEAEAEKKLKWKGQWKRKQKKKENGSGIGSGSKTFTTFLPLALCRSQLSKKKLKRPKHSCLCRCTMWNGKGVDTIWFFADSHVINFCLMGILDAERGIVDIVSPPSYALFTQSFFPTATHNPSMLGFLRMRVTISSSTSEGQQKFYPTQ